MKVYKHTNGLYVPYYYNKNVEAITMALEKFMRRNIYQSKEMAILLTFVGGYIDAYTF